MASYQWTYPTVSMFETEYYFSKENVSYQAKVFPPHLHDRMELYVLLDGDVSFMVESKLYKLNPGDGLITKPNEMHNCILNTNSVHRHACFWFDVSNDFLFSDFLSRGFGENNLIVPKEQDKQRLFALLDLLKKASEENRRHQRFYLALELLDIYRENLSQHTTQQPIPELLKNILTDINEHFASIQNLDYFTEKYFISPSTLHRLFRVHLHTSPKLYLETKRLAYSRQLLKGGHSVLSACMQTGFSDYSNYIRLFKKRFSMTPKQYQNL
ncbi:MAG: helix-turn-helix domain-containing protein [Clostridia bacterium]|nr:helix-turn-helix domain-containing protein [Clostridia bacterium]